MNEKIDLRPKVLELIQKNGPVIPRDLVKEIGGDTFIVGAVLMQLKDSGKVLVTHTKVGGTPAYYCEGQEENLQTLEKYLNDKEKYAYALLKEKKILRDYGEPTVIRLSLRLIKDFAIPLVVEVNGEDEVFWKWYLTPLNEAEEVIKEILPTIKPLSPVAEEKTEEDKSQKDTVMEKEHKNYSEIEKEEIPDEKHEATGNITENVQSESEKEGIREETKEAINEKTTKESQEEPKEEIAQVKAFDEKQTEGVQEEIAIAAQEGKIIKEMTEKDSDKEKELKFVEHKEQTSTEKKQKTQKKEKIILKKVPQEKFITKENPMKKKKYVKKGIKKYSKPKAVKENHKKEGFFKR